jgi:hypothetical protein
VDEECERKTEGAPSMTADSEGWRNEVEEDNDDRVNEDDNEEK